ncbi:MAG TPA: TAXI family TRAP transporter solute-binding subunit [Actinoplanes sp.]|nr:TAXI family TRAP transporter solute-binding subunit [Actinoplanes sp.]
MTPRRLIAAVGLTSVLALAGCASATPAPRPWHDGRLFVATGNTTGVYYQLGGGYADLISKYMPGYEARAEPTGASGDNVARVASGDMDIGLCNGDTAADAATGLGVYAGQPQPIRALARLYRNTMQVVVRNQAKIDKVADMRGKRVSTSTLNSGTDVLAGRVLTAAGLDPDTDIERLRLSLPDTVAGMKAGAIDALFFTGGLPTPGLADLLESAPTTFSVLPTADLIDALTGKYGRVYGTAAIPKATYDTPDDVGTIVVQTLLLVSVTMPDDIAYQLVKLLFEHQAELARVHPEGGRFDRVNGPRTEPVPLHPGALRYYRTG